MPWRVIALALAIVIAMAGSFALGVVVTRNNGSSDASRQASAGESALRVPSGTPPSGDGADPPDALDADPPGPASDVEIRDAAAAAQSYLSSWAFSRAALIEHLVTVDGYSSPAATEGVDGLNIDWSEQAVRSAALFADGTSFSQAEIIAQLEFEKFTSEQAVFGAQSLPAS